MVVENRTVKRVVLSSGNSSRFPGIGYFGSYRSRGNFSTFHKIDLFLLVLSGLPENILLYKTSGTDKSDDSDDMRFVQNNSPELAPQLEVSQSVESRMEYLRRLDNYCLNHVDEPVFIYTLGNRRTSSTSRKYLKYDCLLFAHSSSNGHCLRVSLANAIQRLGGDHDGERLLRMGPVYKESLAAGADWLNRNMGRYRGRAVHQPDAISWLLDQTAGVFLVRLRGKDNEHGVSNEHVICIDADKGEIIDCVERYAMIFSRESIECCVGDGFVLESVAEVRRIEVQTIAAPNARKRMPISSETRKRKREKKRAAKQASNVIK